ncbi:MAG: sigma 54-interacting transcriptional regulator [Bacteriovoracaceae bacterium]
MSKSVNAADQDQKGEKLMQKEMGYVSDLLDSKGLREDDELNFAPLFGKRRRFKLSRSRIDFITSNLLIQKSPVYYKTLDPLGKEKLHYQLRLVKTLGKSNEIKQRYLLKTLEGSPFKHNGNFVNEVFLERGDEVEMGHNNLTALAQKKKESETLPVDSDSLKVLNSELPVLICGETGSGKTTLAKKIHNLSRPETPFIHLNLAAFSKNLLESELFGHVKGAFTGALNDKPGAFREARNGTLFLDEIDSLPWEIQTKLLVFLDEFKVRSVGGGIDHAVSCRLVCAAGGDLKTLVKKGKMRKDFYYRIASGLEVKLPSLRYNEELVEKLCARFCLDYKVLMVPNLVDFYKTLPWPGNIRQLYGHLKKKVVCANSLKLVYDKLDEKLARESSDLSSLSFMESESDRALSDVKYEYVKSMYFKCGQNAVAAAKKLAITPRSVRNILGKSA